MADIGFIRTQLTGIKDEGIRRILISVQEHILGNLRFGVPDHQVRATNFQTYFIQGTTASDTAEFSIAHGLGQVPHLVIPVLDVTQAGARVVPLEVTRAADSRRLYFKVPAGSTSAPITILVE